MSQVFCFGASITYGIADDAGGWTTRIKHQLHESLYGTDGIGEKHELHVLAAPGATTGFVRDHSHDFFTALKHGPEWDDQHTIGLLSIGINDAKAFDQPDNYVSTEEDFRDSISQLIQGMRSNFDMFLGVGYTPADESKTSPKRNPFGGYSYFLNKRIKLFNDIFKAAIENHDGVFIDLFDKAHATNWNDHLWVDGLHPNSKGHQWIGEQVWEQLQSLLVVSD
ncbi:MAG: hypothetical protein HKM24_07520 [Gammaproteobacteria bacterium]|nr:hypothetical protein [Gammaproteobacteria bacterium]